MIVGQKKQQQIVAIVGVIAVQRLLVVLLVNVMNQIRSLEVYVGLSRMDASV
jgi:hypothetical protein